jgi:ATP-dependent helicase Lhr and Lhr-like helicase
MSIPHMPFHPLIEKWFSEKVGYPTDVQSRAWPEIAAGRHVLVAAPTGSGKTLTAFLWAIQQLLTGKWSGGQVRVLYVSPLKALNNDVRRNLITPLEQLPVYFREAGEVFKPIRVLTRSGDTPQDERRKMLRRPPEILIATPESLNLMISSKQSRRVLSGVATVILDEIHAVAGSKRGTHLITAVDRLVPICGEFQRIALSATVRPMEAVAEFIGGFRITEGGGYEPRRVAVIRSEARKRFTVRVRCPEDPDMEADRDGRWRELVDAFLKIITRNRSTLLFANSRRMTEQVTRLINERADEQAKDRIDKQGGVDPAYAHHGSLSREIRLAVEQKLKLGELKAIVATNSLELGIDIGDLDQVVLIQTPPTVSSALQRVGRSGHSVGDESRGDIFPTHGRDFIHAAVMARLMLDRNIEPLRLVEGPLDVLAQILIAMTGVETWDLDGLYRFIRTSWPYRNLTRRQFDLVLEMLAGRYADSRLRELRPRLSIDRVENTVKARSGAMMLVYLGGGTIPDRGLFDMRLGESRSKIGELDEEFVWERREGDSFALGAQCWRIIRITPNDVEVAPLSDKPGIIPFWRAEPRNRDFHFSEAVGTFLEEAASRLDDPAFNHELVEQFAMEPAAAAALLRFLDLQKEATEVDLPHRHHLVIEHFNDPLNKSDGKQVMLHTLWGGRINRPFALAIAAAWERAHNYPLEVFPDDDCILLLLPHAFGVRDLFDLVRADNVEDLLRDRLETTGFFGARFRENAGRALLLPKVNFRKRMPLWLNRLRSKKLMDAVMPYSDFPILLETWRSCLTDDFDLDNLKRLLDEVTNGGIRISETVTTSPSPFAKGLIWQQVNLHMYKDDTPESGKTSRLKEDLVREVALSSHLRPRIPASIIHNLQEKLHRTAEGFAPASGDDLLDWMKERLLIPEEEWKTLLSAMARDSGEDPSRVLQEMGWKLMRIRLPDASIRCICAVEILPRILRVFGEASDRLEQQSLFPEKSAETGKMESAISALLNTSPSEETENDSLESLLLQWLSYYGPVSPAMISRTLGIGPERLNPALETLVGDSHIVIDRFREGDHNAAEVCDRNNLEILLRMVRRSRQPAFTPLDTDALPLFLAVFQGLTGPGDDMEGLQERMEQLFGYPAAANAWEEHILPARMSTYYPEWLDTLISEDGLTWFGCGDRKTAFGFPEDLELFLSREGDEGESTGKIKRLFPDLRAKYGFFDLTHHSDLDSAELTDQLWQMAWNGRVSNDGYGVVRMGILNRFEAFKARETGRNVRRTGFNRWKNSRPVPGNWFVLTSAEPEESSSLDILAAESLVKDRVRQLLKRYGLLFRDLTTRELPPLAWGQVFKTLRIMELSGEIISGHFFKGISGAQFISPDAFRMLNRPLPEDAVFWMNAVDPASLCGIRLDGMPQPLPERRISTFLVFQGRKLVMICRKNCNIVDIHVPPDHPFLPAYCNLFKTLMNRKFNPVRSIMVETINGVSAASSPYATPFKAVGFTKDYRGLEMVRHF